MWNKAIICTSITFGGSLIIWCNRNTFISGYLPQVNKSLLKDEANCILLPDDSGNEFFDDLYVNYMPYVENYSSKHWNLLRLAKSKNKHTRHKAVKSLSQLQLHKWQYKMIAQACDPRTAIGLANSVESDAAYFLPPPFKNLEQLNWKEDLLQLLTTISTINTDVSILHLTERAKVLYEQLLKDEDWFSELEESFKIYHSNRIKKSSDILDKVILQAVLGYSSEKTNRSIMHKRGILKVLHAVCRVHDGETEFQSLIAQILANFALEKIYEKDFHLTGWIGILAQWCKSSFTEVCLPAAKALANLDRDDYHYSSYDAGVYLLHPFQRHEKKLSADIIFVHGLLGATFWTWRQHDSMKTYRHSSYTKCWPKDWLSKDIPNARLISADYTSCLSKWNAECPQIEERGSFDAKANYLLDKLLSSQIGDKPIIWITHSMGGLLVKQILIKCMTSSENSLKSISQNTKGIIFFSVPHKGSDLVKFIHSASYIFKPSVDIAELQKGSRKLLTLNENFENFVHKYSVAVLNFGEAKKTKWGLTYSMLVTEDSSNPGYGDFFLIPVDHLSTCKPKSPESEVYKKVLEFLLKNIPSSSIDRSSHFTKLDFEISNILSLIS